MRRSEIFIEMELKCNLYIPNPITLLSHQRLYWGLRLFPSLWTTTI